MPADEKTGTRLLKMTNALSAFCHEVFKKICRHRQAQYTLRRRPQRRGECDMRCVVFPSTRDHVSVGTTSFREEAGEKSEEGKEDTKRFEAESEMTGA